MAKDGYCVHGNLNDLAKALGKSEELRQKQQDWPPNNSRLDPKGKGAMGVGEDQLTFVD